MKDKTTRRLIPFFVVVLAADQVTKYIALSTLKVGLPVPVWGDYLRWTLTFNPGGAFGMKLGNSTYYLISSLIIFVVLVFYVWRYRQTNHIAIPLTFVSAGAIGNIIDRIRFGEVVDFIDCEFFDIHIWSYHMERWPIFNVADMAVSCGITATIILILYHSHLKSKETIAAPETSPSSARDGNP